MWGFIALPLVPLIVWLFHMLETKAGKARQTEFCVKVTGMIGYVTYRCDELERRLDGLDEEVRGRKHSVPQGENSVAGDPWVQPGPG